MKSLLTLIVLAGCNPNVVIGADTGTSGDTAADTGSDTDTGADTADTGSDTSGDTADTDTSGDTGTSGDTDSADTGADTADTGSDTDTGADTADTGSEPCTDADGDGFCSEATGGDDCNDHATAVSPAATEVVGNGLDENCDGVVETEDTTVDADGDGSESGVDCDDADASVYPGAAEVADDGIDQDCDGADEVTESEPTYVDADGDGFDTLGGDCDDTDAAVSPAAIEIANDGIDNDCDGVSLVTETDADSDGYGVSVDCDDTDAAINPGATEVCDGADNDCDGTVDDGIDAMFWRDVDGDGDGAGSSVTACSAPSGYVANSADCDDADATIHEGASDACDDGVDQNCDGVDGDIEDLATWYEDSDGDGYGDADGTPNADTCGSVTGWVRNNTDCDDGDANVNPGEAEVSDDGIDNDCDGTDSSLATLQDEAVCPSGQEACFVDVDGDSNYETLLMDEGQLYGMPSTATVYENGAGTGCRIDGDSVSKNAGGYYVVSFEGMTTCTTEMTLISGTSWWQNYAFCTDGSDTQGLCVTTGSATYLIDIDWDSGDGLAF